MAQVVTTVPRLDPTPPNPKTLPTYSVGKKSMGIEWTVTAQKITENVARLIKNNVQKRLWQKTALTPKGQMIADRAMMVLRVRFTLQPRCNNQLEMPPLAKLEIS